MNETIFSGYLDVKVSAKVNRGFTPWKAWHRRWCELVRLDNLENGAELQVKTEEGGALFNHVVIPRSSTVCRIESRSKQYSFGVFTIKRNQKPLVYLSGNSETQAQDWMALIRNALCITPYPAVDHLHFNVSLIDNKHSRAANLTGLFGILSANAQEIVINDPATGQNITSWKWHYFHQFHVQAATLPEDENVICVLHTSQEFSSGQGQLYLYCKETSQLLRLLLSHGKILNSQYEAYQRLSQSEGDLNKSFGKNCALRNLSDSDDSGVRGSLSSDDSDSCIKNKLPSLDCLLAKTPGGSEDDDDEEFQEKTLKHGLPHRESGVSLASGVYEEIPETSSKSSGTCDDSIYTNGHMFHVYENPEELILRRNSSNVPPPLPPRVLSKKQKDCDIPGNSKGITHTKSDIFVRGLHKYRSNTLPTKDLRRFSQSVASDPEYVVMSPSSKQKTKNIIAESLYMPMTSINHLKTKLENYYMAMSGVNRKW